MKSACVFWAGLDNGTVQIVCSCDIISEGTDIPKNCGGYLITPYNERGALFATSRACASCV